ncbi:MAG: polysaccharide deacetylase family protein [Hyphomicrobiaceae bacterium]|nr:polysaccharide deacetylase family protein [Hyphomicrobiaceae bacterium]
MRLRTAASLVGLTLLAASAVTGAAAQCPAGAIGTSRVVEIDTTGGPRFGHNQYPGPDFLNPGEIVLTFDDGPHKQLTPTILDALDAHCAKATFFMVGQRAMMYPAMVREVARRGHTIATHTWSHRNQKEAGPDAGISEIELGISAVQKAYGQAAAPFFRFPYLSDPAFAQQHLRRRNTAMFSIDVDSYDFRTRSPSVVMRNVMNGLRSKGRGIILFHDIQPSTAGALGALLSDLKAQGHRVVHMVPRDAQTTLADYDRRIGGQPLGSTSPASLALSQRTVVSPAWEPRVVPRHTALPSASLDPQPQTAAHRAAPPPVLRPAIEERPQRRPPAEDWRNAIFRGY